MIRRPLALVALVVVLGGCATIKENVSVDVNGIIASSCAQLADKFSDQLSDALVQLDSNTDADLPDVDVGALIDRAESLGCSPEEMKQLVAEKLKTANATSEKARELIQSVSGELESVSG